MRAGESFVYIRGTPGSGRSHLLEAACHEARENGRPAIYLAGLQTYEPDILRDLEAIPLVCLDDVHLIAGAGDWELALFHLINGIRDKGNRLLVSADRAAGQLPVRLGDLRSRLLGAFSIETDRLSDEQKLAALQIRACNRGFEMSDEVGRYILGRTDRSMGNLIRLLQRLETETLAHQRKLTIPFVKRTLRL